MDQISVAFVPMSPSDNAATRTFCELPAQLLRAQEISSRVFLPSSPRTKERLRSPIRPLHAVLAATYWYLVVLPRRLAQLPGILRHDVIFIQRSMLRYNSPPLLEAVVALLARILGRTLIYHLDDALYTIVPSRYIAYRCRVATAVLTGNREIAAFAERAPAAVRVLDGWVQSGRYPEKVHTSARPVIIGYVGTFPERHLPPIAAALAQVCRKTGARVRVVGPQHVELPELTPHLDTEAWTPEREFALFSAFDIGVMPLEDTPYNRGKEAFKIKEYLASGLPVVCSAVGHNTEVVEHGVNGFHAASESEWIARLSELVADVRLRSRFGAAGRLMVGERFEAETQIGRLGQILRHLRVRSSS